MPNLDPATRARLADALEGATPEEMAETAAGMVRCADFFLQPDSKANPGFLRAAAVLLAVAEMQERAQKEAGEAGWDPADVRWRVHRDGDASWLYSHQHGYRPRSLPAALATLLRTTERGTDV